MTIRNFPHAARTVDSFDKPNAIIGQFYMQQNSTATIIAEQGEWYTISGTFTDGLLNNGFTNGQDRLRCGASKSSIYKVHADMSFLAGNNNQIEFGVYSSRLDQVVTASIVRSTANSSGRQESITLMSLIELETPEYLEIKVRNISAATNITVTDINVIITEVTQ